MAGGGGAVDEGDIASDEGDIRAPWQLLGAAIGGVGEPQGGLTAGPGEAGGDAGNNPGVLTEVPCAGREGGVELRLLVDEGRVIVSKGLPIGAEKGGYCGREYSVLWLMDYTKEELVISNNCF